MLFSRTTAPLIGLAALAALALTGKPAAADTISFSNLKVGTGDTLSAPYTEGDFNVTFSANDWVQSNAGNPSQAIFTDRGVATIDVMHTDGTVFTFASVDLARLNYDAPEYTLIGLRNNAQVFNTSGIVPLSDYYTVIENPDSTALIDDLKIGIKIPVYDGGTTTTAVILDNIVVQSPVSTVPEPSSIASLGLGALGLGGLMLRARKRKVQSA